MLMKNCFKATADEAIALAQRAVNACSLPQTVFRNTLQLSLGACALQGAGRYERIEVCVARLVSQLFLIAVLSYTGYALTNYKDKRI